MSEWANGCWANEQIPSPAFIGLIRVIRGPLYEVFEWYDPKVLYELDPAWTELQLAHFLEWSDFKMTILQRPTKNVVLEF